MKANLTLAREDIVRLCERVEGAQTRAYAIPKLTDEYPAMTIADGYAVQSELRRRFIAQGHRLVGWKAGLTSKAKMQQMGVDVPSIGFLTDRMARPENSAISTCDLVHPRVECEVAFVLKKELRGPGCSREDVLAATDYVVPAVETSTRASPASSSILPAWSLTTARRRASSPAVAPAMPRNWTCARSAWCSRRTARWWRWAPPARCSATRRKRSRCW